MLYARALEQGFHVSDVLAQSRPHPPGYILYVAAAALPGTLGLGSNAALVAVSIVASAAGAAVMYLVCVRLAGRAIAALVTLALVASPLFWRYGEVAMPYALLVPLSGLLALAFLLARCSGAARVLGASALFGLAAGFRQDLLIFLGPLWFWSLAPSSWRVRLAAIGSVSVACLAWAVPSALLSDGPAAYLESTRRQLASVSGSTTMGAGSLETNLALLAVSVGWALILFGPVLIALLLARGLALARRRAGATGGPLRAFFALWILPPLLFYALVHVGEWGQLLSVVPGLFALLARLLRAPFEAAPWRGRAALAATLTAAALVSAGLFVAGRDPIFSAHALAEHDRSTAEKVAYIRSRHAPDATVVVAGAELLVANYYLPGYTVWFSDDRAAGTYERRLARDTTVVLYEERATLRAPDARSAQRPGNGLAVIALPAGSNVVLSGREVDPGGAAR